MDRTIEFLKNWILARNLKPGDPLPPVRVLAGQAGTSVTTICVSLRQLRSEGLITPVNGRGFALGAPPPSSPNPAPLVSRHTFLRPWRRVFEELLRDVRTNVFTPGSALPSIKELCSRYGVSYKTMRKALSTLVDDGCLHCAPNGRTQTPALDTGSWKPRIVCILPTVDSLSMIFGQNGGSVYRNLEFFCAQSRIAVDTYLMAGIRGPGRTIRRMRTGEDLRSGDVASGGITLGTVFFNPWHPTAAGLEAILRLCDASGPVAVFDETGLIHAPGFRSNVKVFSPTASQEPGRIVGSHLLALGHRRVAFISADHDYHWSQRRLSGLAAVFEEAGHRDGVVAFTDGVPPDIFTQGAARSNFAALQKSYSSWRTGLPASYRQDFDRAVSALRIDTCRKAEIRSLLYPLLCRALRDSSITAWVITSDYLAIMALQFLKERRVRIPADLSILSFDDSPEAVQNNVTSYSFNPPAIASALLGFLLDRKPYAQSESITGFIVDRNSTGPLRTP